MKDFFLVAVEKALEVMGVQVDQANKNVLSVIPQTLWNHVDSEDFGFRGTMAQMFMQQVYAIQLTPTKPMPIEQLMSICGVFVSVRVEMIAYFAAEREERIKKMRSKLNLN